MVFSPEVAEALQKGNLVVIPTDTLYGIVSSACDREAVEKLYALRGRNENKPCILLIADIANIGEFGIFPSEIDTEMLKRHWPGKISAVFDCADEKWEYLHRGTETLAFRVPDNDELRNLLRNTGPLLAPSANIQGQPAAQTIAEAKDYFGDRVSVYVDGGRLESLPSTVARLRDGAWEILRKGAVKL